MKEFVRRGLCPTVAERALRAVPALALIGLVAMPLPTAADTLHLGNGDRISGTLVALSSDKFVFETEYAGTISLDASFVTHIETQGSFAVRSRDGSEHLGKLGGAAGNLIVEDGNRGGVTIALVDVTEIAEPDRLPARLRWYANVSAGVDLRVRTKDESNAYLNGKAIASHGKHAFELDAEFERERESGEVTDAELDILLRFHRILHGPWSAIVFNRYEHNRSDDLDLRLGVGPALGYRMLSAARDTLRLEAGPAYLYLKYDGIRSTDLPIARVALNYVGLRLAQRLRIDHEFTLIESLEQADQFLFRSDTAVRWRFAGFFTIGGKFQAQWANSPAPDIDEKDLRFFLTLGYGGGDPSLTP